MDCGMTFSLEEYVGEIDNEMMEKISLCPCDRV